MQITETETKVLIVGAGPSGLMMAAQMLRYGIQPLIIDNKQGPTSYSNALGVQARSMEIYRQLGLSDKAVANGKKAKGLIFAENGQETATVPLMNAGEGQTPFPYLLLYQQYKNERLLLDYLTQNTCPVYWNTSLIALDQQAVFTDVILKSGEDEYHIRCDWVVGADGAHSNVRKHLNIPFTGETYPHYFYLADVKINASFLEGNYIQLYLGKNEFCGFFPMPEENEYRVIGNLQQQFEGVENVTFEQILPDIIKATGKTVDVIELKWFTTYKLHHRMAESFRKQNCFLIGDAAHIHSPVGGQGMNTGLQDGYNLAWKLAGVINGNLPETILNTFPDERMPLAKELLRTTDRIFNIAISRNWFKTMIRRFVLPRILRYVSSHEKAMTTAFKLISQTDISYRHSKINVHLSLGEKVKAGDRLPYLEIYDEKKKEDTDLHAWCNKPGFTLIILGRFDEMFLFNIAKWITNRYQGLLNFFYLPPSGKNLKVFETFETDPRREKAIIVRPDMYIGYMNDLVAINLMDNYLRNVVGLK